MTDFLSKIDVELYGPHRDRHEKVSEKLGALSEFAISSPPSESSDVALKQVRIRTEEAIKVVGIGEPMSVETWRTEFEKFGREWTVEFDKSVADVVGEYLSITPETNSRHGTKADKMNRRSNEFAGWLAQTKPWLMDEMVDAAVIFMGETIHEKDLSEQVATFSDELYGLPVKGLIPALEQKKVTYKTAQLFLKWEVENDSHCREVLRAIKQISKREPGYKGYPTPLVTDETEEDQVEQKMEGFSDSETSDISNPREVKDIWENGETLLKAKYAIFDLNSKEHNLYKHYAKDFLRDVYDTDKVDQVLEKRSGSELGDEMTKDLIASDFLHWLQEKGKTGPMWAIENISAPVRTPETEPTEDLLVKLVGDNELKKRTDPNIESQVRLFVSLWEADDIGKIGIGVKGSKGNAEVTGIKVASRDGNRTVVIPDTLLRHLFIGIGGHWVDKNGISAEIGAPGARLVGLRFYKEDGRFMTLGPDSDPEEVKKNIFNHLSINDHKLSGDFEVLIGRQPKQ